MAMDPVNKKALKKDFKNRKDQDIDNDGDVDSSDEYLHKRRKAVSKAIKNVKESLELAESDFKVGQKVEYEAPDGGEYYGTVIKLDKPEEGAYYHVKLENGKVVKASPDQLEAEDDDEDDDKEDMNEDVRKMSHGRLKFHMNNKNVPHGSYSWDEMKAERDRRLKTGQSDAYRKAKSSMSEEVELEEMKLSAVMRKIKDGEWEAMQDVKKGERIEVRDTETGKRKMIMVEKAESQAQAIAARIALKHKREGTKPKAGTASADMMKMSEKDLEDYTKAKKGAPEKVQKDDD